MNYLICSGDALVGVNHKGWWDENVASATPGIYAVCELVDAGGKRTAIVEVRTAPGSTHRVRGRDGAELLLKVFPCGSTILALSMVKVYDAEANILRAQSDVE